MTLFLISEHAINDPLLYLSLYFKQNRDRYYHLLQRVREESDWLSWIRFFMEGVRETANEATVTARRITSLFEIDRGRTQGIGRAAGSALRVHKHLQHRPLTSLSAAAESTGLTYPTVSSAMGALEQLGLVEEVTGRSRGKLYAYKEYLQILNAGA